MPDRFPQHPDRISLPVLLSVTGAIYIVVLSVFSGRIYAGLRYRKLGWEDGCIMVAIVLALAQWSLLATSLHHRPSRGYDHVPIKDRISAQHLVFISGLFYPLVISFIKVSIASTLLRFKRTRLWNTFLWTVVTLQILSCIASLVARLICYKPLASIWNSDRHPNTMCVRHNVLLVTLYVEAGIGAATDSILTLALIPFLIASHCSLKNKVGLSIVMAIGLFATAASIRRATLVNSSIARASSSHLNSFTLWTILEEQAGILAFSIPSLAPLFSRTLPR
ncbi:hypothetical protein P280DRAFT_441103, partial [Massarina eburnea CBS 473.64]